MQQPPWSEKQKEGLQLQLRKTYTQKTKYKNDHPGGSSGGLPNRKGKEGSMFYISTPNRSGDRRRYERPPEADLSTYDPAGRFQCTQSTMGKRENEHKRENNENNLVRYNFLCIKKKNKPTTEHLTAAN